MKKYVAIILGLFLVLGFTGCNSDGSDIKVDLDEFIGNPTNLVITGETLSWDEVPNADGYIVYANDEEVDKVNTNSFDFGSLSGDLLIFQVRTRAPRGMQDSALSAKLAFVVNREQVIADVELALAQGGMDLDEDFSEELVNKGMVSADVEGLVDEMGDFMTSYGNAETFEDFIIAIRGLVEEADNIEALISALVKTQLVDFLEMLIAEFEAEIESHESDIISGYSWYTNEELQEMIDQAQMQIDVYDDLIDQIESDPDTIVLAVTSTIEYFISIEEMISDELVALIDGLGDVQEPSDLNANELAAIKEEIVSVLRETMPTGEEMVLVLEVIDLVSSLSGATINYNSTVENYKGKMAAQSLYSLEAFINFLDVFDLDFFEEFIAINDNAEMSVSMISAESGILVVKYFDKFYDDNENLLDTINEVFSDEEKEALFDEYVVALGQMGDELESASGLMSSLSFEQLMDLQVIFEDSFGELLDAFVESDGEIIRQAAINSNFSDYENMNLATGMVYDNDTEFNHARELARYDLLSEAFILLNSLIQSLNQDELNEITSFFLDSIFENVIGEVLVPYNAPFTEAEALAAKEVISTALGLANNDILAFLQAVVGYVVEEDVLQVYKTVVQDTFDYYTEEYGADYDSVYNPAFYQDDYRSNASLIFVASYYDDFMTNSNRGTLDDILEVVFSALNEEDLRDLTGLTSTEITAINETITEILDLLDDEFGNIKTFDYKNLSPSDLEDIGLFKSALVVLAMQTIDSDEKI